jgi:2-octaprenyl-6-methoxyphenol hydroxylase
MSNHNNIIILGCGLSGMITALALAKYNISTTIIEAKSTSDDNFFDDIRTTAINSASKEFCDKIGVWRELSKLCGLINDIYVVDNKAPEILHFAANSTPENKIMGYLVENTEFKKCLYNLVQENKFINILDNINYQEIINHPDYCQLTLSNNTQMFCKLLIVCDSRNSKAKNLFFSNDIEEDYNQKAITFIVEHEKNHEGSAIEHFLPKGPFAILPLKIPNRSSIVWTVPKDYTSALLNLPEDEFTYLVQENFGPFLGKIQIRSRTAAFPLKAYTVTKYYNKSIALVADTAHVIHPLAGQGLNQGVKDIDCLSSLIATEGVTSSTLDTYQKQRKQDNENMLLITDTINSIFSSNSRILHGARQAAFKTIETLPSFKKILIKYAMGEREKR